MKKTPDPKTECGNCQKVTALSKLLPLEEVQDLEYRLDIGSEVPAGECRKCGCLAYLRKEPIGPSPVLIEGGVETELYAVEGQHGRIIAYCPTRALAERVIRVLS